jgi:transcriptional regulator with XRE-family HTH domain
MLNNLSKNLFYLRKRKGLRQQELRESLGVSGSTWSNYENGITAPSIRELERIARYFGVTSGALLEEDLAAANPESEKFMKRGLRGRANLYPVNEKLSYVADDQPNFELIWNEVKKLREDVNTLKQLVNNK